MSPSSSPPTSPANGPDAPDSVGWTEGRHCRIASPAEPLALEAGGRLDEVVLEYETYGELAADAGNAILITHALTGDAHVAGWDRLAAAEGRGHRARKPGWWDAMVGPGKPIDTERFFVICSNVIGSCYGSTGPGSTDPATGRPYGLDFPVVLVEDWVQAQARLLDRLGIERLYAVIGGSLGGQQALEWALALPDRVERAVILASAPRLSVQGLAFNAVGRHAIMNDAGFAGGAYHDGEPPDTGLAVARMLAHITYLSDEGMHQKFGRRLQNKDTLEFGFGIEFQVESYLDYQGRSFAQRFDANSYLYITRAMDYYDAAQRWGDGDLVTACKRIRAKTMVVSFSSDWLYTPREGFEFATALCRAGRPATYANLPSAYGHDAFLIEIDKLGPLLERFLRAGGGHG